MGQRVQAWRQEEQLGATIGAIVGIKRKGNSAQTGTVAVQREERADLRHVSLRWSGFDD